MKKIGGRFLQELRREVRKLFMHSPLSFCNKFPLKIKNLLYWQLAVTSCSAERVMSRVKIIKKQTA